MKQITLLISNGNHNALKFMFSVEDYYSIVFVIFLINSIISVIIMRRSNMENKYLKNRSPANREVYKKQKDYCGRIYKKKENRIII